MKKLMLGLCAALALTACDEMTGTNVVTETLNAVDKKGKQVSIKPGTYKMGFKYDQKHRELEIKIKKSSEQGKDVKLKLAVASDVTMPRDNGSFMLASNQIGQSWDLEGQVDTQSVDSDTTRTTESCSIPTTEYVCHETCDSEGCNCSTTCADETVYIPGSHEVEYYYTTTTRTVNMQFKEAASTLARFNAVNVSTNIHYTYEGTCYQN
jgi:hypothetical protein